MFRSLIVSCSGTVVGIVGVVALVAHTQSAVLVGILAVLTYLGIHTISALLARVTSDD